MKPSLQALLVDYDSDLFDLKPEVLANMETTLGRAGATLEVAQHRTETAILQAAGSADLVLIQSVRPLINKRVIPGLRACRGIIRLGLGYDSVDVQAATQAGILVSNVTGWCNQEVAEHTLALFLSGARKITRLDRQLHDGLWSRQEAVPIFRLQGKTAGLVGCGRIAQMVAQRLQGFGLNILGFDPYVDEATMATFGIKKASLDEILSQADFISVHARLTDETFHLLSQRELGMLKPDAFLINTSRGAIIDESALISALKQGQLCGAALDVMEHEPLSPDSELCRLPNVILTPHLASYSNEAVAELYLKGADIAASLLQGIWVETIVNPQARPVVEKRWGVFHQPNGRI